jgi:DNA-3-methyladenine glycosylase I
MPHVIGTDGPVRTDWANSNALLAEYYDTEWGMPVLDEQGLFERISLEAFQAGLSWLTILRKRAAFRVAFDGFDPQIVAAYGDHDVERLLVNPNIVRNSAKIRATISNAQAVIELRGAGGLAALIWSFQPEQTPTPEHAVDIPTSTPDSEALAAALKAAGFLFVGPTTAYALMEAIGVVDTHIMSSHRRGCSGLWNVDGSRKKFARQRV